MSFAAFIRIRANAQPARPAKRQYKYEAKNVDAMLDYGERVVKFMQSLYGPDFTVAAMEKVARRTRGSQPSCPIGPDPTLARHAADGPEIIDLTGADLSESEVSNKSDKLPYGFGNAAWKKSLGCSAPKRGKW